MKQQTIMPYPNGLLFERQRATLGEAEGPEIRAEAHGSDLAGARGRPDRALAGRR